MSAAHLAAQLNLTLCDPMDCGPPGSSGHGDSPGKNTGVGYSIQYCTVKCRKAQLSGKDARTWEGVPDMWTNVRGHANMRLHLWTLTIWRFLCMELAILDVPSVYGAPQHGCRAPEKHCPHSHQPACSTCHTPSWFSCFLEPQLLYSLPWVAEMNSRSLHQSTWYLENPFGNTSCTSPWHHSVTAVSEVCSSFFTPLPNTSLWASFPPMESHSCTFRLVGTGQSVQNRWFKSVVRESIEHSGHIGGRRGSRWRLRILTLTLATLEDGGSPDEDWEYWHQLGILEIKMLGWPKSSFEVFHNLSELFGQFSIWILGGRGNIFLRWLWLHIAVKEEAVSTKN